MFKIESYITPIILNYVGKFIKNFKPEQSQVSLWGGDATFQNLDLKLSVLNDELKLPFRFISGHIHELSIHVPWVKIASEPIVVTINTIECILKMRDESEVNNDSNLQQKMNYETLQEETPSSYIKTIVTKVVNNITINCNNLILKFVEEDIVLSVNIRFFGVQTVNNEWKPSFTDINATDMILRKLITIEDLTLCLDRMDASGKIEIYQDPVVYRCSMMIRWLINYQKPKNDLTERKSITRFDIHCKKIEFSMTEHQLPMIMRLVTLIINSLQSELNSKDRKSVKSSEEIDQISVTSDDNLFPGNSNSSAVIRPVDNTSWGSWAWQTVTSIVPDWSNDLSLNKSLDNSIKVFDFGIYVDETVLTFKVTEITQEVYSRKNIKVKYRPCISLRFSAMSTSILAYDINFTNIQIKLGGVGLYPQGNCTCGFSEVKNNVDPTFYVTAGSFQADYCTSSLFDVNAEENNGLTKNYKEIIYKNLVSKFFSYDFDKSTALIINFINFIEIPEEISRKELFRLNRNFEFTNFKETKTMQYYIGNLNFKICSGIIHRISAIADLIENDFLACFNDKNNDSLIEPLSTTIEEFDALSEYVATEKVELIINQLTIQVFLANHEIRKSNSDSNIKNLKFLLDYPRLIFEIDKIELTTVAPIYPLRVVLCACTQIQIPEEMLNSCYKTYELNVFNLKSKLYLSENNHMIFLTPFGCKLSAKSLIYPQYWSGYSDIIQASSDLTIENLTITATKVKFIIIYTILSSIFLKVNTNISMFLSLFHEACNETNQVYLELTVDRINYLNSQFLMFVLTKFNVGSVKMFVLNDKTQAFVLSGPENQGEDNNQDLFYFFTQLPRYWDNEVDNLIIKFHFYKTCIILDPLLFDWLDYNCNLNDTNNSLLLLDSYVVDETSSDNSTRKKFPSLHENVHSLSEGECRFNAFNWIKDNYKSDNQKEMTVNNEKSQSSSSSSSLFAQVILNYYSQWRRLIFNITIDNCVIYQPTLTINCLGVDGIEEAKEQAFNSNDDLKLFVINTSKLNIQSASWNDQYSSEMTLSKILKINDVKLKNFPWTLDFMKFHCYTLIKKNFNNFLNIDYFNATIDSTLKSDVGENHVSLNSLGFCIYINTSPILFSLTNKQLELIDDLLSKNLKLIDKILNTQSNQNNSSNFKFYNENFNCSIKNPLSPTQIFFMETDTISTSASTPKNDLEIDSINGDNITAWIQWTITKMIIELFTDDNDESINEDYNYKVTIEFEDIITSLDWQTIYIKLKNKITSAKILHYRKLLNEDDNCWKLGDFTGFIMSSKSENLDKKLNENDFLSFTLTKAKSNNVYHKWMRFKNKFSKNCIFNEDNAFAMSNYITEIVIEVQMLEIILPINLIEKFKGFFNYRFKKKDCCNVDNSNNHKFPLVYLDFKGITLIIPIDSPSNERYDTFVLTNDGISLIPHSENPICRMILRPDIYELAAQSNILNTPSSILEDRQYQIKINGISVSSTNWLNYHVKATKKKTPLLFTMNENPALEWNELENISIDNISTICPLINRFDLCCIIAPSMILKSKIVVCGNAIEITCLTDIEIVINLDQIKLFTILLSKLEQLDIKVNKDDSDKCKINTYYCPTTLPTVQETRNESIQESYRDSVKDSGVDVDSSSVDRRIYINTKDLKLAEPYENVINCGKLSVAIYKNDKDDLDKSNFKIPLVFVAIYQPNVYISQHNRSRVVRVNCFDISLLFSQKDTKITSLPNGDCYKNVLVQTKSGDPHPTTGIPPSIFVIKWENNSGHCNISADIGRPTKINVSSSLIDQINNLNHEFANIFDWKKDKEPDNSSSINDFIMIKNNSDVIDINLTTKQIVVAFIIDYATEIISNLTELSIRISSQIRKVNASVEVTSLMITTNINGCLKALVNPLSCNLIAKILLESWQDFDESPLIRLRLYSSSINIDLGPEQVKFIEDLFNKFDYYFKKYSCDDSSVKEVNQIPSTEQYYQDDLRAGAFQFADGSNDQVPLPYQVIFSNYPQKIMSWKYPQPRILTRLNLTNILWNIIDDLDIELNQIYCIIEYWNDNLMSYQRFIQFNMSESDNLTSLLNKSPTRAVSCLWKAVICSNDKTINSLTPRDLAGCLRIDSYFNSSYISTIEVTFNVNYIKLSLFNNFNNHNYNILPFPLDKFKLNNFVPLNQCFADLTLENNCFVHNKWINGGSLSNLTGKLSIKTLDYESMTMYQVLESLEFKAQLNKFNQTKLSLTVSEMTFRYGPEVAHTLILSLDLWNSIIKNDESRRNCSILNKIILANDSNLPIRISQDKTTDDIVLQSHECYLYSWRKKSNSRLRVAIKIDQTWIWSDLFKVNNNNSDYNVIELNTNSKNKVKVHYKTKSIMSSQKVILFTGQLVIKNELNEDFELKLIQYNSTDNKIIKSESIFALSGKSPPQSFVINDISNVTMRLRFLNLTSVTSWTGDIPLNANPKCDQPWLVKLPLNNKNQFLSIWVRNIRENLPNDIKILVVLSPLYLIQSWLANPVDITIETPALNSSIDSVLSGRGERQQIHCPGTFEHCHSLKLLFNEDINSNLSIPISYNSVDQRSFFKLIENDNKIDDILNRLSDNKNIKKDFWPSEFENYNWVSIAQSQTYIQIKYRDAGLISSTLLVEIRPWCFILNTYSKNINLVSPEIDFTCTIPSNSVTSPPKISEIFHIEIESLNNKFMSPPLQFAESNRGFIKPQINGLIPLEGSIEIFINCGSTTVYLIINSHIVDSTRIIKIMSSHVVCNLTSYSLKLAPICVDKKLSSVDFTRELTKIPLNLPPSKNDDIGLPIESWCYLGIKNSDANNLYSFISLMLGESNDFNSWSCPIKLEQSFGRNCVSITNGNETIPMIVTTQKDHDIIYITIIEDRFPQFTITNSCSFSILIGHPNAALDSLELEAPPFTRISNVRPGNSCHYTLKKFGNWIPDSSIDKEISAQLWLCIPLDQKDEDFSRIDVYKLRNNSISMKIIEYPINYPVKFDKFMYLDRYGPVKIIVTSWGHTIFINIEPKSNIEVSVRDIRSRLMSENDKSCDSKLSSDNSKCSTIKNFKQSSVNNLKVEEIESTHLSLENITNNSNELLDTVFTLYLHKVNIIITQDDDNGISNEVAALYLTNTFITITSNARSMNLKTIVGDLQLDNQLFNNGGYDFPVVLINQKPTTINKMMADLCINSECTGFGLKDESLLVFELSLDKIFDRNAFKNVYIKILPTNIYIEDKFISQLLDYVAIIIQPYIFTSSNNLNIIMKKHFKDKLINGVRIPTNVIMDTKIISSPLRLQNLTIEPVSILLSVHTSVRLYIALDHSPLHFAIFERRNLFTTPYRLGNALTMHYLSGAIFGAGWVVGSLEILGSPGSFAQAVGLGLKDFISLPFQGLLHGPWGFIVGITHGSASLMKNVTAGTVNSVTKLASSVAKNLDRLTLDNEHLQRQEESRRLKPQGMTQGFYQGLTSFGISILAGVAGLAHHPLQNFLSSDSTTRGIVTGVGLGLVGVLTKPLSGAAELVALTGQGLLQGTGWNPLPSPKRNFEIAINNFNNMENRFLWKLMDYIIENHDDILYLVNADLVDSNNEDKPVVLILTRKKLIIINIENDNVQKMFSFNDFYCSEDNIQNPKSFRLIFSINSNANKSKNHSYSDEQKDISDEMRTRVEQYILSGGLHNYYNATSNNNTVVSSESNWHSDNSLLFVMDINKKNYLMSVIKLIKRQIQQKDFSVI